MRGFVCECSGSVPFQDRSPSLPRFLSASDSPEICVRNLPRKFTRNSARNFTRVCPKFCPKIRPKFLPKFVPKFTPENFMPVLKGFGIPKICPSQTPHQFSRPTSADFPNQNGRRCAQPWPFSPARARRDELLRTRQRIQDGSNRLASARP